MVFTCPTECTPNKIFNGLTWVDDGNGFNGYRRRQRCIELECTAQFDAPSDEMGVNYNFGGQSIDELQRRFGMSGVELCRHIKDWQGKASRIDLALDCKGGALMPHDYHNAIKSGQIRSRGREFRFIEGNRRGVQGETLYIGSSQSDRQLRIYDKAAEQRIVDAGAWMRLELQCRRAVADAAMGAVCENGVDATVNGHLQAFMSWDDKRHNRLFEGESVEPEPLPRNLPSRRNWLLTQCVAAMAKEMEDDPTFIEDWLNALAIKIGRKWHEPISKPD